MKSRIILFPVVLLVMLMLVPLAQAGDYSGLWVGNVIVNSVSESRNGETVPTPAAGDFTFRVIIHVDADVRARLLKEVVQMVQSATETNAARYILVTDDSKIWEFKGVALRDGSPVGYRVSTAAYDFDTNTENYDSSSKGLIMSGTLQPGGTLTCALSLSANHPTNPFKHVYHPDHNNLDEDYAEIVQEAYGITRSMTFLFASEDPRADHPPGWGVNRLAGTFEETIDGLHRHPVKVSGDFELRRISVTKELNR